MTEGSSGTIGLAEIKWLHAADVSEVERAESLFDSPVREHWVRHFLGQENHHLGIAYIDGVPAGFVSGVETTHPDKGTEMFLYELGVDERCRGRGIATALVQALADRARQNGCYGMWAMTSGDNAAALATYRSAGAIEESDEVMLSWHFSGR